MALKGVLTTPSGRDATHRFLYLDLVHNANAGEEFHYVDIARLLSLINRRLYRQGLVYHVANVSVHDSAADVEARFATIPNTWYARRAWFEMFKAWKKQRAQALDSNPPGVLQTGKWSDFKVYMNQDHITDVDWPLPTDCEGDAATSAEWNYADIHFVSGGTEYTNHCVKMMGEHDLGSSITGETSADDTSYGGTVGAIHALNQLWTEPQEEPESSGGVTVSPILGMNMLSMGADNQLDDLLDDIMVEGDTAPYTTAFPGRNSIMEAPWTVREIEIDGGGDSGQKMGYVGGFPVPLGLLCVETKGNGNYSSTANVIGICIELVPGTYQGVAAHEMW